MGILVTQYDYNIGFKKADLLKVGGLLEKQPFGEVYILFTDIQRQITEQDAANRDASAAALSRQQNEAIEAEIERRRQAEADAARARQQEEFEAKLAQDRTEAGQIPSDHVQRAEEAEAEVKGQPVEIPDEPGETLIEKGD